jgi:hypothetical protein
LADLIAQNKEQFVNIAANLASDSARVRDLRGLLRDRMKSSPLMDEPAFARGFEQALRGMWLKFLAIILLAITMLTSRAAAQTTRPTWQQSPEGQLILRPFDHAPYPHASRAEGFKGSKQFFPKSRHYDDSTVAVFIPRNYTPADSVNYLVHFHGHMNHVSKVITTYRLCEQLSASGVNAILIVPQGPKDAADSGFGKLELDKGAFESLINEVADFLHQEGKLTTKNIGRIALSAHSGGYKVTAAILHHGGLTDHISDVFLLDASYGSLEWFAQWCDGKSDRRLVSFFTEHLADENKTLMEMLDKAHVSYARLEESAVSTDAIKPRTPLFIPTTLPHNDVPMKKDYLKRLVETSALADLTSSGPSSPPPHRPSAP